MTSTASTTRRRTLWWRLGLVPALVALAVFTAMPAGAARERIVKISTDPYTAVTGPTAQHRTEVEPDTYAFGTSEVAAFQVGRIVNGGATDIGWATTHDAGRTWRHGVLPGTTVAATPPGPYFGASDASVAFDARHRVWIISYLGLHASGGGIVDVLVSRSTDGFTWSSPITVAATGTFFDKNWTACDNTPTSRFFGNCYTEFDDASQRDLEVMSTSSDGGATWGPVRSPADAVHGLGGQPVTQPNGRVVVPFEATDRSIRAFTSDDGGATWNASVLVSPITAHRVAGGIRTSPLPSAEVDRLGRVYVAWQDSRFEAGGTANDIVLTTSDDGTTWSAVSRIPIDAVGSDVDHFIPGLAVDRLTAGGHALLALTYYFYPAADCTADTCRLDVGFTSSVDGGRTWSEPDVLAGPMRLSWLASTTQGVMVGDYISTSFLAGGLSVLPAFAVGFAPPADTAFDEPMFSAFEHVRPGTHRMVADPVRSTGSDSGLPDQAAPALLTAF
jgi:BNR repeat protein